MLKVNINDFKAHLSEYLERGDTLLICRRNVPVAELRSLAVPVREARPIGLAAKQFKVPATFFDALPDDEIDALSGL